MKTGRFSKTAEQVALARAYATLDPPEDRVCDDPIAISYLSTHLRAYVQSLRFGPTRSIARRMSRLSPYAGSMLYVPARVAFIDQALLRRLEAGLDQLVLLGAGFDSRAERFAGDLHGVRVFELDFPATQARKLSLRPAAPGVTYLAIDLAVEPFGPALLAAGFDPARRSAFIWEGVIYYLTPDQAGGVVDSIRKMLQPGGGLTLDYILEPPSLDFPYGPMIQASLWVFRAVGEPILSRLRPDEVVPFFNRHGFNVTDRAEAEELQRRYFRGRNTQARILPIWGCLESHRPVTPLPATLPVTGALFAGGQGRRLGGAVKAELRFDGERLLDRSLRFLGELCAEVLLLPGPHLFQSAGKALMVPDALPDRGPPGALLAALETASFPFVFALGADMPRPSQAAARLLYERLASADASLYVRDKRPEPLFAFYGKRCAAPFRVRLERTGASFTQLLSLVTPTLVPLTQAPRGDRDGRFLVSVNTPADAAALGIDAPPRH